MAFVGWQRGTGMPRLLQGHDAGLVPLLELVASRPVGLKGSDAEADDTDGRVLTRPVPSLVSWISSQASGVAPSSVSWRLCCRSAGVDVPDTPLAGVVRKVGSVLTGVIGLSVQLLGCSAAVCTALWRCLSIARRRLYAAEIQASSQISSAMSRRCLQSPWLTPAAASAA